YQITPGTSFVAAALTEPLACALHGVDASQIVDGDTVVILGSGPLGLLLAATASLRGARVIMTGHGEERLALARHFGADIVIDVNARSFLEQRQAVLSETVAHRAADCVREAGV